MDAAARYLEDAERCERLAAVCEADLSRAFFKDAAAHWRQKALEAEHEHHAARWAARPSRGVTE
jgi:hypothetical protein